jgi:DtxR family Mn-dependent transcriptional regulator
MDGVSLTPNMEDYLEAIFYLKNLDPVVRVRDIARHLEVTMPSVSDAVKTLKKQGLVRHEPYGHVELTDQGEILARKLLMRHQQLTHFLRDILGVDSETAESDACRIEHVVSHESMERLLALIGAIESCTDKNCSMSARNKKNRVLIPEVTLRHSGTAGLHTLAPGGTAQVAGVSPHKTLRRRLLDMGFTHGAHVQMCEGQKHGAPYDVRIKGYTISLTKKQAELVQIHNT